MKYKRLFFISFLSSTLLISNLLHAAEEVNLTESKEWSVSPLEFSTVPTAVKDTGLAKCEVWDVQPFVFSKISDVDEDANLTVCNKEWIILPFAFSTDTTGLAGGVGVIKQGLLQPQTTFVAAVFAGFLQDITTNGVPDEARLSGGFISFSDYKFPNTERFFFSFTGFKRYYPKEHYHFDGSHDSDKDDVFISAGDSNFFYSTFRYVLPLGAGLDNPGGACALLDGFAIGRHACGYGTPILSGTTSVGLKTFYQYNSFENWQEYSIWENKDLTSAPEWETNGLRFFLTHDNTDFDLNPSRGYHFELQYSKDFGWGDSTQSWDFLEFKYNHYFPLDNFSFTKQNVLALSLWTGYSFSWDNNSEIAPGLNLHRPPIWEGARLGGYSRMRGYDKNRFSDKAVSYATAEYRAILKYNPLKDNDLVPVKVDWFQLVGFVEVGRVHDRYNFDLLSDMKYDVGISLRAMVEEVPIRLEVALGDEGTNLWLMINQPFDF